MTFVEWAIIFICVWPFVFVFVAAMRRQRFASFDGMRLGSSTNGETYEVVDPPWWNLRRMLLKRKSTGEVDFMMKDATGKDRLVKLKTIHVNNPHDRCPLCKRPYRAS